MEQYCGYLQSELCSRVHPWANLNNRILHKAYLEQIDKIYYLEHSINPPENVGHEVVRDGCEFSFNFPFSPIVIYEML